MTNLKKWPVFSRWVICDVAPLSRSGNAYGNSFYSTEIWNWKSLTTNITNNYWNTHNFVGWKGSQTHLTKIPFWSQHLLKVWAGLRLAISAWLSSQEWNLWSCNVSLQVKLDWISQKSPWPAARVQSNVVNSTNSEIIHHNVLTKLCKHQKVCTQLLSATILSSVISEKKHWKLLAHKRRTYWHLIPKWRKIHYSFASMLIGPRCLILSQIFLWIL